jgi:hypothetical protein
MVICCMFLLVEGWSLQQEAMACGMMFRKHEQVLTYWYVTPRSACMERPENASCMLVNVFKMCTECSWLKVPTFTTSK